MQRRHGDARYSRAPHRPADRVLARRVSSVIAVVRLMLAGAAPLAGVRAIAARRRHRRGGPLSALGSRPLTAAAPTSPSRLTLSALAARRERELAERRAPPSGKLEGPREQRAGAARQTLGAGPQLS